MAKSSDDEEPYLDLDIVYFEPSCDELEVPFPFRVHGAVSYSEDSSDELRRLSYIIRRICVDLQLRVRRCFGLRFGDAGNENEYVLRLPSFAPIVSLNLDTRSDDEFSSMSVSDEADEGSVL